MRTFSRSNQFKKDLEKLHRQGKDLNKVKHVLQCLIEEKVLSFRYKDHPLKGNWDGSRDCHIEPDCVLIYTIKANHVHLERIGSHSELFN